MNNIFAAPRSAAPCLLLLSLALSACGGGGQDGALPPDSEPKNLSCTEHAPPGTTAAPVREGLLCTLLSGLVCSVNDVAHATDDDVDTAAQVVYRVGLLDFLLGGAAGIRATLPGPVPAGRLAAFDLDLGAGVLDVALGRNVTLSTWRNGEKQEERGTGTLIALDLLGRNLTGNESRGLVGFVNTLPYDEVQVTISADVLAVDLSQGARIHELCLYGRPTE